MQSCPWGKISLQERDLLMVIFRLKHTIIYCLWHLLCADLSKLDFVLVGYGYKFNKCS